MDNSIVPVRPRPWPSPRCSSNVLMQQHVGEKETSNEKKTSKERESIKILRCFGTVGSPPTSSQRCVQWACNLWEYPPLTIIMLPSNVWLETKWSRVLFSEENSSALQLYGIHEVLPVILEGGNIFPPHPQLITLKSGISNNIKQTLQMAGHCRFLSSLM